MNKYQQEALTFCTNYKVVDVKDDLPEKDQEVIMIGNDDYQSFGFIGKYNRWYFDSMSSSECPEEITHWLKPVHNSILLTSEELDDRDKKIGGDAWEAGARREMYINCDDRERVYRTGTIPPDKQQYINSLIKK